MNEKYMASEVFCQFCKKSLGTGYLVQKRKFCSNKCQARFRQEQLRRDWLTTGRLSGFTGGSAGLSPTGDYVREYLFSEQEGKCSLCGIGSLWNQKPLRFVLDHINGDPRDHSRDNLRLICPNCDSQTDTYKARNKGKGRRSRGFSNNKGL